VNFKKIIATLIVSICITSSAQGMELVKDIVKNEVLPAAAIIGTGAALSVASDYMFCAADSWYRPNTQFASSRVVNIKQSILAGALLSLPILGLARFGFATPYPQVNVSKLALIGGSVFSILTAVDLFNYKAMDARNMSWPVDAITNQSRGFMESNLIKPKCDMNKVLSMAVVGLAYKFFAESN
jgi:hypothetical protein